MRRLIIAVLALAVVGLSACRCTVERRAVEEVERSHELISAQLLKYVEKDPVLKEKDRADWRALVESDKRNIERLKKALE